MKSTQRPSKPPKQQPKSHNPNPKPDLTPVANEPVEQHQTKSQPVPTVVDELPQQSVEPPVIALPHQESQQQYEVQRPEKPRSEKPELSERFQRMKFFDSDKPVSRIIFECYHCQKGILCEYTGEPVMGEYKGRPSVIPIMVECPSCGKTAIRLSVGEVLSTTAIPSPWA